jgi:AcrR family transcriptional regulator
MIAPGPRQDLFAPDLDYSTEAVLARLPRGRHGLPREFVDQNHRNRLLAATVDSVAERGYLATTVATITSHAGVSRGAFYRHFADKEDSFLSAYDLITGWLEIEAARVAAERSWARGVGAAVEATLALLAADPRLARLCAVEVFPAGPSAVARQEATIDRLCVRLRRGRAEGAAGPQLPEQLERILIGGAISLVARYVNAKRSQRLEELTDQLTEFLLAPYLGTASASRLAAEGG